METIISVVAERGFPSTTVEEVVSRAGIDRRTFGRNFQSLEDCFSEAWEEVDAEVQSRMETAFKSRDNWPDQLREALSAGMSVLAADGGRARFYVCEPPLVGGRMRERQRMAMDRLSLAIDKGREGLDSDEAPPGVADAISGAIWHRMNQLIWARREEELPAQVPLFMHLAVLPYRGTEAAQRELDQP